MHSRAQRLEALLRKEVAWALRDVQDPALRHSFVTLTGVSLSKDFKSARIFYSVIGTKEERLDCGKALKRVEPRIQSRIYGRLRLKVVPQIHFEFDPTPEQAGRIETILRNLEHETS